MDANYIAYEALTASREAADWAFWSMVGTWFAGVATFFAVCVSLHLGLRKPRVRISCQISLSIFFIGPYRNNGVSIVITNQSLYAVKVTSVNWVFKKNINFFQPFSSKYSMKLPQKLDYGEQATLWIDLDNDSKWIEQIAEGLKEQGANPKDFRCVVSVTTGESFTFKVNNSLMERINTHYQQISKQI
ncbi:hypothetical protein C3387_14170 [Leclercia sp. LSNIH6]|nr:hypothetical protein C3370_17265 [Leclercia sp. LSNIH7]POU76641.1 hypothetical protein C3387_14170 [Leclercia sp. LSNIH6]POW52061.1 hypothetical protein C3406_10480 [Leclercia sp. LSNIH8]